MMDRFEKIMQEAEREGIKVNQGLSRLLLDMWRSAMEDVAQLTRRARVLFVVSIISSALCAALLAGCVYLGISVHEQAGEIDAIWEVFEEGVVIEETTTTTEETVTTITQDAESGNNVYQAGEGSSYTQEG